MYPGAQFAALGGSVTFTCNATGVPGQNYTWRRLGQEKPVGSGPEHTIDNIKVADDGYYVCDATVNPNQQNTAYGHLAVENACKFHCFFYVYCNDIHCTCIPHFVIDQNILPCITYMYM